MDLAADATVEAILRGGLAREGRALASVVPVLRHLLGAQTQGLVNEAILARVRGMILDLAAQLARPEAGHDPALRGSEAVDALADTLMGDEALLGHCHALAAEGLMAERLMQRHAIDPVLSPLLQELIAAEDPAVASLAMATLAAQSRFVQSQRRMELPLGELPAELFHALVGRACDQATRLQAAYDEGASRLGLLARLVGAMRRGALAALGLDHAGVALFATALANETRMPRSDVVLACHEGQSLHLALLLRAAGLAPAAAERQLLFTDPAARFPEALGSLSPNQAAAVLASERAVR
ncbi:MAG: hypothetical protein KAF27_03830 [Porphyrobacter sp.]|nr:hypothetical protein [Porphyrobacter sp.]